jgi:hypothetical protein
LDGRKVEVQRAESRFAGVSIRRPRIPIKKAMAVAEERLPKSLVREVEAKECRKAERWQRGGKRRRERK